MGSAELGREVGDSAGALIVGGLATAFALPVGLAALGGATAAVAVAIGVQRPSAAPPRRLSGRTRRPR